MNKINAYVSLNASIDINCNVNNVNNIIILNNDNNIIDQLCKS